MQIMLNSVKLTFLRHSVGPKIVMKLRSLSLPLTQPCLPNWPLATRYEHVWDLSKINMNEKRQIIWGQIG